MLTISDITVPVTSAATVTTNTTDGSFMYQLNSTAMSTGSVTATATLGANVASDTRSFIYDPAAVPPLTPTTVTIGTGNEVGVKGSFVRVPIYFNSGYQAGAMGLTIAYDPLSLTNPTVEIAGDAAATGKTVLGNILPGVTSSETLVTDYNATPNFATVTQSWNMYRIYVNNPATAGTILPLPDGVVAYLKFSVAYTATAGATVPIRVKTLEATDLKSTNMVTTIIQNSAFYATSALAANFPVTGLPGTTSDGAVGILAKPGDNFTAQTPLLSYLGTATTPATVSPFVPSSSTSATLSSVLKSVFMLMQPAITPVNGTADLNADGAVQINEVQRVINSYVGL